jgi:hypothetical protein
MNTLTAEMDVATPFNCIIKKVEQRYMIEKTYTVDEAFDIVGKRLSRNYGVEIIID